MNDLPLILPYDKYNEELVGNVHPLDWKNPEPAPMYNLVVIGAGTAGLVAAAGTAAFGGKVALIEKRLIGGDCLNLGCVPSKTIISSSRVSEEIREAMGHGVRVICGAEADFPKVMERMRRLRARISRHDSAERFKELGVDVFLGEGRFTGQNTVEVGGKTLRFKKALIATGARPFVPPVEGLMEAGFLTNETVFNLTSRPSRIAVLGGGAIGCEMAQAFGRLGSEVTILQNKPRLMEKEDPEASDVIEAVFRREGVRIVHGEWVLREITLDNKEKVIHIENGSLKERITVDELLVAVGRARNVDGLGLDAAGVKYDQIAGVLVDDHLRTTNRDVYAAGDVCMRFMFTHTAEMAARIVIQNALFGGRRKFSDVVLSWCTFTDPEVAHVGVYEEKVRSQGIEVDTFKISLSEIDRTVMEGEEDGFAKIHVKKGTDRILGATIVARNAGDMISEITLAMSEGVGLKRISDIIHPYPTRAEVIKKLADEYNKTRLTPGIRKVLSRWLSFKR
ncbi:MAG: mercuric reductase [Nitrospirota bacterium]